MFIQDSASQAQIVSLIKFDTNTSISRNTDTAESITCTSSVNSTELFVVPANTISSPGDELVLEISGKCFNNDGSNRALQPTAYIDGVAVASAAGQALVSGTTEKSYGLIIQIIYTGSNTANLWITQSHNNSAGPGSLPQGTQYGNTANLYRGQMFVSGIAFDPTSEHTISAKAAWPTGSTNVYIVPLMRSLKAIRY